MKSFRYKWLIIIFLLFAIALMCGCTSIGNNNQTQPANTNLSSLVNHTVVYQNWSFYPLNMCPIPTLIFNNSQEIINLNSVISIANPDKFPNSDKYSFPWGSIIYHSPGYITRIFDSTGKQLLIVNDSENPSATKYFSLPVRDVEYGDTKDNITYYTNQSYNSQPCIAISIFEPDSGAPLLPLLP